jgi:hypothetical protein
MLVPLINAQMENVIIQRKSIVMTTMLAQSTFVILS